MTEINYDDFGQEETWTWMAYTKCCPSYMFSWGDKFCSNCGTKIIYSKECIDKLKK